MSDAIEFSFLGTFDGGNHLITVSLKSYDGEHLGLFVYIGGNGIVKNVRVAGVIYDELARRVDFMHRLNVDV